MYHLPAPHAASVPRKQSARRGTAPCSQVEVDQEHTDDGRDGVADQNLRGHTDAASGPSSDQRASAQAGRYRHEDVKDDGRHEVEGVRVLRSLEPKSTFHPPLPAKRQHSMAVVSRAEQGYMKTKKRMLESCKCQASRALRRSCPSSRRRPCH
eukprot:3858574-Rhodomonas_salina.1